MSDGTKQNDWSRTAMASLGAIPHFEPPGVSVAEVLEERHQEMLAEVRGLRVDLQALAQAIGLLRDATEEATAVRVKGWKERAEEIEREEQ